MMIGVHHYNIIQSSFSALKILLTFTSPLPHPMATMVFFIITIVLPFSECHVLGII